MAPFQAHGPVSFTPSRDRTRLGAPKEPSPRLSFRRPLLWPSVWQLWQLNQPSKESRASWNSSSPRSAALSFGGGPSETCLATAFFARSTIDTESENVLAT